MLKGTFVFLDLETTGLDHHYDKIVEIGIVVVKNGKITKKYKQLINPGIPIPYEAQEVHGITDEMVKNKPRISNIKPKLKKILEGRYLITHSKSNFDLHFLRKVLGKKMINKLIHINTCKLSYRLGRHYNSHSLKALKKRYKIQTPYIHRALGDAMITYKCFKKMIKKHNIDSIDLIFDILY